MNEGKAFSYQLERCICHNV